MANTPINNADIASVCQPNTRLSTVGDLELQAYKYGFAFEVSALSQSKFYELIACCSRCRSDIMKIQKSLAATLP